MEVAYIAINIQPRDPSRRIRGVSAVGTHNVAPWRNLSLHVSNGSMSMIFESQQLSRRPRSSSSFAPPFSRRHCLPPGPPENVHGEFTNVAATEVFLKWKRKYGTQPNARGPYHRSDHLCLGQIFSYRLGTRISIGIGERILALSTEPYGAKVLNDINSTTDLLDKRGEIYSNRSRFVASYVASYVSLCISSYLSQAQLSFGKRGSTPPYGDYRRRWCKVNYYRHGGD